MVRVSGLLQNGFHWRGAPPQITEGRAKVIGAMWGGRGQLVKGDIVVDLLMFTHSVSEPPLDEMSIKGVQVGGEYFDIHSHTFMTEDALWLHETGWFDWTREERSNLWDQLGGERNYNSERSRPVPDETLRRLGFRPVIRLGGPVAEKMATARPATTGVAFWLDRAQKVFTQFGSKRNSQDTQTRLVNEMADIKSGLLGLEVLEPGSEAAKGQIDTMLNAMMRASFPDQPGRPAPGTGGSPTRKKIVRR